MKRLSMEVRQKKMKPRLIRIYHLSMQFILFFVIAFHSWNGNRYVYLKDCCQPNLKSISNSLTYSFPMLNNAQTYFKSYESNG